MYHYVVNPLRLVKKRRKKKKETRNEIFTIGKLVDVIFRFGKSCLIFSVFPKIVKSEYFINK